MGIGCETVALEDLVQRDGIYYKKHTNDPFTGRIFSISTRGFVKKGKHDGPWELYYDNGQLMQKEEWKAGELHGYFESYTVDGLLKEKKNYKDFFLPT